MAESVFFPIALCIAFFITGVLVGRTGLKPEPPISSFFFEVTGSNGIKSLYYDVNAIKIVHDYYNPKVNPGLLVYPVERRRG